MTGLRVILGVTASVGVHVGSMWALNQPASLEERAKRPATIELAQLPPPPEPEPPKRPPPEPEPKPEPARPTKPIPAAAPPPQAPPRAEPSTAAPLVLAGLSMSNAGVGVPTFNGPSSPPARSDGATHVAKPTPPAAAPAPTLTAVSDLSKKPVPPQLDSALARFYPAGLRSRGVEGEALIRVVLAKDGKVAHTTTVSESHSGFAPACEKALRTSRWEPPIDKSGNPTMTALKYRCRFRVNL